MISIVCHCGSSIKAAKGARDRVTQRFLAKVLGSLLAALVLAAGLSSASAAETAATPRVTIEVVSETAALPAEGGTVWLAVRQQIIPHWHTYWLNPGDSGEPTDIAWTLPEGFAAGEIVWPVPERIPYGPLVNFGFSDEAIFLVPLTVPAGLTPGEDVTLNAHVFWLVCADVCIPEDVAVDLTLPVTDGPLPTNYAAVDVFARAREDLPRDAPWPARFAEEGGIVRFALMGEEFAEAFNARQIESAVFFPYDSGIIDAAADQTVRYGAAGMVVETVSGHRFRRDAVGAELGGLFVFEERMGDSDETRTRAFTVIAPREAIPAAAMTRSAQGQGTGTGFSISVGQALLFALLGGIILNLMPCVFPVVFLKALTFVSVAHEQPWKVRAHGLAYTGGILVTFAGIAALLIALKAAGAQIGWGFQLQSPPVVAGLAFLLFAVGLNLSGVFSVGGSFMGFGGSIAERRGLAGSFFTGVLAVVVASPCTAPFMATALGFALVQPAYVALAIFLALGLGLALPYLLLSFAPFLLKMLPRPGAWMAWFKQALAIPMYGAAAWLLWVLAQQVGLTTFIVVTLLLAALAYGLWFYEALQTRTQLSALRGGLVAALVIAVTAAGALVPQGAAGTAPDHELIEAVAWSPEALEARREAGETVFVNFTAAWCITCLVNERVVFTDPDVTALFEDTGITYMKADWTNRDADITRALERFGRSGVPLYVVYRPGEAPQVLPQVLNEEIVTEALAAR